MAKYKFHYFDHKGIGEPIRLIFASANVPYDDVRVTWEEWPKLKKNFAWQSLPVLEVDGEQIAQSNAIMRYLSREFELYGETSMESAKVDELSDVLDEFHAAIATSGVYDEEEPLKKSEIVNKLHEELFPKYFKTFSALIGFNSSGFLVGNKLTFVDLRLAHMVKEMPAYFAGYDMASYPVLKEHQEMVLDKPGIKEWIEKRPHSQF